MSTPAFKVCLPCVCESTSENWSRCSSGNAGRGSAFGNPYVMTLAMETLGAEPFALIVSRSRDHWNRKLFNVELLIVELQLATKIRSCVAAVPFAVGDSL